MRLKMNILNTLKLVTSKKNYTVSPVVHRRNKLAEKISEQIAICESKISNTPYAPKRMKTFTNKQTGERMTVETTKRLREWFWTDNNGKINLSIKYGATTLLLDKKGSNAIEVNNNEELLTALNAIKLAVVNGELDDVISSTSTSARGNFTK